MMKQMIFMIDQPLHDEMKERARLEGLSMGNILRGLVSQYLGHGPYVKAKMGRPVEPAVEEAPPRPEPDDIARFMADAKKPKMQEGEVV